MLQLLKDKKPWFRAKRLGYGAGLPFKWQGWLALCLYVLAMVGLSYAWQLDGTIPLIVAGILSLAITTIFLLIVRSRTEGGWKWRGDFGA